MPALVHNKKQILTATFVFVVAGIFAIVYSNLAIMLLPFLWLSIPFIFKYTIGFTEHFFWFLIATLPLSAEINITPSLGLDFPDEILMMFITGCYILKVMVQPSFFPIALVKHNLFLLILLHLFWILITCIFSVNTTLSLKFFAAHIWYIVPFVFLPLNILHSQKQFKQFTLLLLLPMLFVVVQCIIRHAFLGFTFEGIKQTLSPFFRNHVTYSSMLVCLIAVAWALKKLTPTSHKYYKWIGKSIWLALIALFFAYSRGAWVALVAGVFMYYIVQYKWLKQTIIFVSAVCTVAIIWLCSNNNYVKFAPDYEHTIMHTNFTEHLQSTTTLKDLSNAERFYRWIAGVKMVAEKPMFGFGPNNFYNNYQRYTVTIFKTYVSNNPEHSSVHNYFLLTALEQGIIGLIIFCLLLFAVLIHAQRLYHLLQNQFYKTIAITVAIVVTMIATVNLMSDMIETDKIGSIFWLCVGIIIVLENKLKEEKESIA